jgi:hypothetical protein
MKTKYLNILIVALASAMLGGCGDYPPLESYDEIFVSKTLLNMYTGDRELLSVSPADVAFSWSIDNESVAHVNQRGLVEAVGPGIAEITVSNGRSNVVVSLIVTVPTADNVIFRGMGENDDTVQIIVQTLSERVAAVRCYWNDDHDSIDIAVNNQTGIFMDTIVYTGTLFNVVSIDKFGNKSLISTALKSQIRDRTISYALMHNGKLTIQWNGSNASVDYSRLSYINSNGDNEVRNVLPSESTTVIDNYMYNLTLNTVFIVDFIKFDPIAVQVLSVGPNTFRGPHLLSADAAYTLLAADFDYGGSGVGFYDLSGRTSSSSYRPKYGDEQSRAVDISGSEPNCKIEYTMNGEWLAYSITVVHAGTYEIDINLSANSSFNAYAEIDGSRIRVSAPSWGSWGDYRWIYQINPALTPPRFQLTPGTHKFIFGDLVGFNLSSYTFTRIGD